MEDVKWIAELVKKEFPYIKNPEEFIRSRLPFVYILEPRIGFIDVEGDSIKAIVVKPEHRGNGHGKRLLEFAIALGGRRLISRKDNGRANNLYRKLSFKPVKEENGIIHWELSPQKPPE